jgi:replicative DNA helicase
MQMSQDEKFVRITSGGYSFAQLIPASQNIYSKVTNKAIEHYVSVYNYNLEHKRHFDKNKSVKGITDVTTNKLLWDLDCKNDVEKARQQAIQICDRLLNWGVEKENIRIFFSGNKGFHIDLVTDLSLTRKQFENIVFTIGSDLSTFDPSVTDENQLIRLAFTKHPKSGLYKIPLSYDDLTSLSVEDITAAAKDITGIEIEMYSDTHFKASLPKPLADLKDIDHVLSKKTEKKEKVELKADFSDIDLSKCPKWMAPERYALAQGAFFGSQSADVGERNKAFMILAATFKAQGFTEEHTLALLMATAEKQAARTGEDPYSEEQMQREIISEVFSPQHRGGQYGKDDELLVTTRERFGIAEAIEDPSSVEEIIDVGNGFKDFAKNMNQNRVRVGLESLDKHIVMTVGMLCTVVSAPGGGKTALANLFAETVSKEGENVLYFSLDLYKNLLFGRMLQRYVNYDIQKILKQFENNEVTAELFEAYSGVLEAYSNVGFSFKSSSIDDIETEIKNCIARKGKSPKLVIVDYLDKVRSPFTDPTQSSAYVAGRLSDIAKKYSTLVLLMAQPSKFGSSGPNEPFKSYRSLKGSSSIESDSRLILGIHRDGYDPSDQSNDIFSSITVLKNNTGPLMKLDYYWDGQAGTFSELDLEGKRELKRLRDSIEKMKDADDDL